MNSYKLQRKCLYCGNAISDQIHKARKFCPRVKLSEGTVNSCKDNYNSNKRRITDPPYKRLMVFHKEMHERIDALVMAKGSTVNLEQINRYAINLYRPVQFKFVKGMYKGWFVEYLIELIDESKYKITKHGILF